MSVSQGYFLSALHQALVEVLPEPCRRGPDSWMENGSLRLEPKNMGPTGANVAYLTYQVVFTLEGLPFRECDPAVLLATIAAWLQDHDPEREGFDLPDPGYSITPNDEHSADLEVQVAVQENPATRQSELKLATDQALHWTMMGETKLATAWRVYYQQLYALEGSPSWPIVEQWPVAPQ